MFYGQENIKLYDTLLVYFSSLMMTIVVAETCRSVKVALCGSWK